MLSCSVSSEGGFIFPVHIQTCCFLSQKIFTKNDLVLKNDVPCTSLAVFGVPNAKFLPQTSSY